jgi:hypothetical protein
MSVQMSPSSTAQVSAQCHRARCARTLLRASMRRVATWCKRSPPAPSLHVARGDGICRQDSTRRRNGHEARPFRRTPGPIPGPHHPCGTRHLLLSPRLVAVQHVLVKLRPAKIPLPEERRRALSGRPLTPPSPPRDRSKRTSRAGDLQSPCPSRPGRNGPRTLRPTPPK